MIAGPGRGIAAGFVCALAILAAPEHLQAATDGERGGAGAAEDALLDRAMARFRAGDHAGAAADLATLRRDNPDDAEVALLLGIALYRDGQPDAAEPVLRAATASTDEETAAAARLFLGLIERDRGDADAARAELGAAAGTRSPLLAESSRALLRSSAQRLVTLTFLARGGFDSNVPVLPGTTLSPSALGDRADGDLLLLGAATVRPLPSIGLAIEETSSYRQQLRLTEWSIFSNVLGARWAWLGDKDRVLLRYAFELMTLGGELYTLGHVAQLGYRRGFAGPLGFLAGYTFRHRDYRPAAYQDFTGSTHQGHAGLGLGTDDSPLQVELRFLALWEDTAEPAFTALGLGGSLLVRARLGARTQLSFAGSAVHRSFEKVADTAVRVDWQLWGDLGLAVDLNRYVGLIGGASVLRNLSEVPPWEASFNFVKLTAYLGVAAGWSGP